MNIDKQALIDLINANFPDEEIKTEEVEKVEEVKDETPVEAVEDVKEEVEEVKEEVVEEKVEEEPKEVSSKLDELFKKIRGLIK